MANGLVYINTAVDPETGEIKQKTCSEKQVQYYMNPIYFFNGKWLSLNLYLLFKVDLDGVLPEWARWKFNDVEL